MGSAAIKYATPASSEETKNNVSDNHDSPTVLSLLNLDQSISNLSHAIGKPATIEHVINHLLAHRQYTTPLEIASGRQLESMQQTRDRVHKSIVRFLKEPDRWTALASVLLKSLAFHRSIQTLPCTFHESIDDLAVGLFLKTQVSSANAEKFELLPIVDLPRTKYNRPYLPYLTPQTTHKPPATIKSSSNTGDEGIGENENLRAKISVSHQYPYVSIVQSSSTLKIGLDLVVFQYQKNEYTPTINDFLKSFETSFTSWEWERIQHCRNSNTLVRKRQSRSDESKLREFFLRWSIKEAYTKALGLGMHVDFSSFETRLFGIDDVKNTATKEAIWDTVINGINTASSPSLQSIIQKKSQSRKRVGSQYQYSVLGEIVYLPCASKKYTKHEVWEVIFVPISVDEDETHTILKRDLKCSAYDACVCICRGPTFQKKNLLSLDRDDRAPILIEHIEILDLINLHKITN
jgi:phosphopantetheinyl transferase